MDSSITDLFQASTTATIEKNEEVTEDKNTENKENTPVSRKPNKRKRRDDENEAPLYLLTEVFLRVIYPLSSYLSKNIAVGISKSHDYKPVVIISHCDKQILLSENTWNSLKNYLNLIECYLLNNVFGRKTSVRLASSDIEVDNIKSRGDQCVRFRDLTKHDVKVQLTLDEFHMLTGVAPAIDRYIQQLNSCEPMVRDYLWNAIEISSDSPLIYGPVDSSIYNRLPQEVNLYRHMKSFSLSKIFQDCSNTIYSSDDVIEEKELAKTGEISESEVE